MHTFGHAFAVRPLLPVLVKIQDACSMYEPCAVHMVLGAAHATFPPVLRVQRGTGHRPGILLPFIRVSMPGARVSMPGLSVAILVLGVVSDGPCSAFFR